MGEACCTWTYRPTLSTVVILSIMACAVHCLETPPVIVGKVYPRGNHWAVGHLMGKKSLGILSGGESSAPDTDYLTALGRGDRLPDWSERPSKLTRAFLRALVDRERSPMRLPANTDVLLRSSGSRRGMEEERRDRYLREMSHLLLLVLKQKDSGSR